MSASRIVSNSNWQLGLGMHNFRAAERKFSVERNCGYLLRGVGGRILRKRHHRDSVKRPLRSRRFQRKSKPAAMQLGQKRRDKTGKSALKLKKSKHNNLRRAGRRHRMFRMIYDRRIPLSFRMHCKDGFNVFCKCMRECGMGKAIGLHLHWRTEMCIKVQSILRDLRIVQEAKDKLEAEAKGVLQYGSNTGPRPIRSNYTSFNKWQGAIEIWQIGRKVCQDCYRIVFADPKIGSDGRYWKGAEKFMFKYDKDKCFKCGIV